MAEYVLDRRPLRLTFGVFVAAYGFAAERNGADDFNTIDFIHDVARW